jgi:hypothetical protein
VPASAGAERERAGKYGSTAFPPVSCTPR